MTVVTDCELGVYRFSVRSSTDVKTGPWSEELTRNNGFCPSGNGGIHFEQ